VCSLVAQGKFSSLEGGVRVRAAIGGGLVPFLMRGTMNHGFFTNYDWFPSLLHSAGLSDGDVAFNGQQLSGHNMWSVLSSNDLSQMPARTVWVNAACGTNANKCDSMTRETNNWLSAGTATSMEDAFYQIVPPATADGVPKY
jgi:hypothetical protein